MTELDRMLSHSLGNPQPIAELLPATVTDLTGMPQEQADWDESDHDDDYCARCSAILMESGRCWYCARSWVWRADD